MSTEIPIDPTELGLNPEEATRPPQAEKIEVDPQPAVVIEQRVTQLQDVNTQLAAMRFDKDNFGPGLELILSALTPQDEYLWAAEKISRGDSLADFKLQKKIGVRKGEHNNVLALERQLTTKVDELFNQFPDGNNWARLNAAMAIFDQLEIDEDERIDTWRDQLDQQALQLFSDWIAFTGDASRVNIDEFIIQLPDLSPEHQQRLQQKFTKIKDKALAKETAKDSTRGTPESEGRDDVYQLAQEIIDAKKLNIDDLNLQAKIKLIKKEKELQEIKLQTQKRNLEQKITAFNEATTTDSEGRTVIRNGDRSAQEDDEIKELYDQYYAEGVKFKQLTDALNKWQLAQTVKEGKQQNIDRSNAFKNETLKTSFTGTEFQKKIGAAHNLESLAFLLNHLLLNKVIVDNSGNLLARVEELTKIHGNNKLTEDYLDTIGGSEQLFALINQIVDNLSFNLIVEDNNLTEADYRDAIGAKLRLFIARMIVSLEVENSTAEDKTTGPIAEKVAVYSRDKRYLTIDRILGTINSYPEFFEVSGTANYAITEILHRRLEELRLSMEANGVAKEFINGFITQIESIKDGLDFGFLRGDVLDYRVLGAKWTKKDDGSMVPAHIERMTRTINVGRVLDAQTVNTNINDEPQTMGIGEYFSDRVEWSERMGILQQILCVMKNEMLKQPIGKGTLRKKGPNPNGKTFPDESKYSMANIYGSDKVVNDLVTDIMEGRVDYTFALSGHPIRVLNESGDGWQQVNVAEALRRLKLGANEKAILIQEATLLAAARDFGGDATAWHQAYNLTASKLPAAVYTEGMTFDRLGVADYYESRNNQKKLQSASFVRVDMDQGSMLNYDGRRDKMAIMCKFDIFWHWMFTREPQLQALQKIDRTSERYHSHPDSDLGTIARYCTCDSFDGRILPSVGNFMSQRRRPDRHTTGKGGTLDTKPPDTFIKLFAPSVRLMERGEMIADIDGVHKKFYDENGLKKRDVVQEISAANTDVAILMGYLGGWNPADRIQVHHLVKELLQEEPILACSGEASNYSRIHQIYSAAYNSFVTALRLSVTGEVATRDLLGDNETSFRQGLSSYGYKRAFKTMDALIEEGISLEDDDGGLKDPYRRPLRELLSLDVRRTEEHRPKDRNRLYHEWLMRVGNEQPQYRTTIAKVLPEEVIEKEEIEKDGKRSLVIKGFRVKPTTTARYFWDLFATDNGENPFAQVQKK